MLYIPMLAHVSGFHSFSRPPLHPLTSRGERGEDRTPREVMEVPCEWAPSTVWGGREGGRGREGEGGRECDSVYERCCRARKTKSLVGDTYNIEQAAC